MRLIAARHRSEDRSNEFADALNFAVYCEFRFVTAPDVGESMRSMSPHTTTWRGATIPEHVSEREHDADHKVR